MYLAMEQYYNTAPCLQQSDSDGQDLIDTNRYKGIQHLRQVNSVHFNYLRETLSLQVYHTLPQYFISLRWRSFTSVITEVRSTHASYNSVFSYSMSFFNKKLLSISRHVKKSHYKFMYKLLVRHCNSVRRNFIYEENYQQYERL